MTDLSLTGRKTWGTFHHAPDNGAGSGAAGDAGKQGEPTPPTPPEKTFTQDALDRIVRDRLAKADAKHKAEIEALGIAPEEVEGFKQYKTERQKLDDDKKKAEGRFQEIIKENQERSRKEIETAKGEATTMKKKFERTMVNNAIMAIGQKNSARNLEQVAALTHSFFRVTEQDAVEVVDKDGNALIDGKGAPFTPESFLADWLVKNDHFLESKGGGTGGYKGGANSAGRVYTREELKDTKFYEANKADILKAQKEGRIKQ